MVGADRAHRQGALSIGRRCSVDFVGLHSSWPSGEAGGSGEEGTMATLTDAPTGTRGRTPAADTQSRMRELYEKSAAVLFPFLLRLTFGNRQLAEDLLQETYLRVWRKLDQLPADPASVAPWLFTVARRVAIDAARARDARPVEVGALEIPTIPSADGLADEVVDSQIVRAALSRLSDQHREVLFEVYYRDAAPVDVARRLGVPLGTIRSRTFYALRSLGVYIADARGEPAARPHQSRNGLRSVRRMSH
jgi:RNA polymerase sigma-70 factor (ECF subfamily)